MPERNSSSMKKMFRKWVITTHHGKNPGTQPAPFGSGTDTDTDTEVRGPMLCTSA
jgi:hypothetical protein